MSRKVAREKIIKKILKKKRRWECKERKYSQKVEGEVVRESITSKQREKREKKQRKSREEKGKKHNERKYNKQVEREVKRRNCERR